MIIITGTMANSNSGFTGNTDKVDIMHKNRTPDQQMPGWVVRLRVIFPFQVPERATLTVRAEMGISASQMR